MADHYLGEIRIFAGSYAPIDWALCDGQLMSIAQNQNLFLLIGTAYGGNGVTTFALPDLRGRLPLHRSNDLPRGASGGVEKVTLTTEEIPAHTHPAFASAAPGTFDRGTGAVPAASPAAAHYAAGAEHLQALHPEAVAIAGGGEPHSNLQPYLCLNFIIALTGYLPS